MAHPGNALISTVEGSGRFDHLALFYADGDEYLACTMPLIEAGHSLGELVAVSVPTARVELLEAALKSDPARVR